MCLIDDEHFQEAYEEHEESEFREVLEKVLTGFLGNEMISLFSCIDENDLVCNQMREYTEDDITKIVDEIIKEYSKK